MALCTCSNISSSFSPLGQLNTTPPYFLQTSDENDHWLYICLCRYLKVCHECLCVRTVCAKCQGNCMCNSYYNWMIQSESQAGDKGNCFLDTYFLCFISQRSISAQHRISLLLNSSFISFRWQIWHTVCCLNNFKLSLRTRWLRYFIQGVQWVPVSPVLTIISPCCDIVWSSLNITSAHSGCHNS